MTIHLDTLFRGDIAPLPKHFTEGDFIFSADECDVEVLLQLSPDERRITLLSGGVQVCEIVRVRKVPNGSSWRTHVRLCGEDDPSAHAHFNHAIGQVHDAYVLIGRRGGQWVRDDVTEEGVVDAAEALA